jgi:hypothetical protein
MKEPSDRLGRLAKPIWMINLNSRDRLTISSATNARDRREMIREFTKRLTDWLWWAISWPSVAIATDGYRPRNTGY